MKVCVFGAGAVGGHLAARLAAANKAEVSVVARGLQLEAIRSHGAMVKSGGEEIRGKPAVATDDPASLPQQDLVLVTLKGQAIPALVPAIERLLAREGCAVFMLNGLPWWWHHGRPGAGGALPLLDPESALWTRLRERTLGCVVLSPNEVVSPGVVVHIGANRWLIGEPSGAPTARLQAVIDLFNNSGLTAETPADLRAEIWRKLTGNAAGNSLAALTRLGHYALASDPDIKRLAIGIMRETLEVAAALGWDLRKEIDVEKHAGRATPGPSSTPSMLQDVLRGRSLEVEAHLGQTQAFGRETGVSTPTIDLILPLLRGLDRALRAA